MKHVRIESPTGHPFDTKIFVDGHDISECVTTLDLHIEPGDMPRALVELLPVGTSITLPESVVTMIHQPEPNPVEQRVLTAAIEWRDRRRGKVSFSNASDQLDEAVDALSPYEPRRHQ